MDSAFGVDHGQISKATQKQPRLPRSTTAQKIGRAVRVGTIKGTKAADAPLSVSGLGRAVGRGTANTGVKIAGMGGRMQAHGGRTGTAVAALGLGGAGYAYHKAKVKEPKTKAPKVVQ